jgi:hypothetical protein
MVQDHKNLLLEGPNIRLNLATRMKNEFGRTQLGGQDTKIKH